MAVASRVAVAVAVERHHHVTMMVVHKHRRPVRRMPERRRNCCRWRWQRGCLTKVAHLVGDGRPRLGANLRHKLGQTVIIIPTLGLSGLVVFIRGRCRAGFSAAIVFGRDRGGFGVGVATNLVSDVVDELAGVLKEEIVTVDDFVLLLAVPARFTREQEKQLQKQTQGQDNWSLEINLTTPGGMVDGTGIAVG